LICISSVDYSELTALLDKLDTLADDAWRAGDERQEFYYYGVMFGLETARDELAAIVADMMREATTPTK
jgi:hypothetical protein